MIPFIWPIFFCFICGLIGWAILGRKVGSGNSWESWSRVNQAIISSELCARDLPSKRLLGKGLASVGYETELKGERFARLDFIGVPSSTFRKEATVVASLEDHQNVVRAHDWVVDKTSCSLVLEYMEDDLLSLIQKRKESPGSKPSRSQPFELAEALHIILQIASGMNFLHEQNILHGDLKTKNILVTCMKEEERDALLSVKVADYGLVRTKRKSMSFVSRQARKLDVVQWKAPDSIKKLLSEYRDETSSESDSDSDDERVGAPDWVLLSSDVYSFAVTCSQILTGEDPYPNLNWKELGDRIVSGRLRPKLPGTSPPLLNGLLKSCWSKAADERPTFSNICETLEQILHNLQTRSEDLDTELPMMTTFLLEDALSLDSGAGALSRSSDFMGYILETRIHADDEAGAYNVSSGAAAGSSPPRLVDGAHEDHIIPGNEIKILRDQENISSTEKGELKVECFHSVSLDYLERNWISLMKNPEGVEGKCKMLLSIADNLQALQPSNDPLPWDVLNMGKWKDSLWELIKEMKTVEESCSPSLLRAPGVYVLTATPYSAFLRALAAEIDDKTYNEQRLYKAVHPNLSLERDSLPKIPVNKNHRGPCNQGIDTPGTPALGTSTLQFPSEHIEVPHPWSSQPRVQANLDNITLVNKHLDIVTQNPKTDFLSVKLPC